jgi:hypothetical protein
MASCFSSSHRNSAVLILILYGIYLVDIDRTPGLDERYADPLFAVSDAFRRARRRHQDRAKVMRHEVKALHKRIDRTLDQPD